MLDEIISLYILKLYTLIIWLCKALKLQCCMPTTFSPRLMILCVSVGSLCAGLLSFVNGCVSIWQVSPQLILKLLMDWGYKRLTCWELMTHSFFLHGKGVPTFFSFFFPKAFLHRIWYKQIFYVPCLSLWYITRYVTSSCAPVTAFSGPMRFCITFDTSLAYLHGHPHPLNIWKKLRQAANVITICINDINNFYIN